MTTWRRENFSTASQSIEIPIPGSEPGLIFPSLAAGTLRSSGCKGSGFLWSRLNTLYAREGACKVRVDKAEDKPALNTIHRIRALGESPDAMLLHKTLPLARSGDRLELNSQAELNLPGSSSAGEATHYSEVAASEGCPW